MCLAVPGRVIDIYNSQAKVNIMGVETIINTQLVENLKIGEYVLIHVGCAVQKIEGFYYDELIGIYKSMLNGDEKLYG